MSPQPLNKTPAVGSWPLSFPAWGFSREASGLQADTKSHTYFPVALPLETQTLYCPIVSLRSQVLQKLNNNYIIKYPKSIEMQGRR